MAMPLITTSDPIVGANSPRYPDYKNQAAIYIAAKMQIEHNVDGTHVVTNRLSIISGVYTGNGTTPRSFTSSTSGIPATSTPVFLLIWTAGNTSGVIRLSSFPDGKSCYMDPTSLLDNGIISLDAGGFTIGDNAAVNDNAVPYYFLAWCRNAATGTYTGDVGAGSDPDWIEHGEALTGGTGTATANKVENHIYNTAFLHEHDDNGKHTSPPFNSWIETGSYTPNDVDDRDIALSYADLQIKFLWILNIGGALNMFKSNDMAGDTAKITLGTTAAFQPNYIQSLGTGTFQVGTALNTIANGTHYYVAIGGR